MALLKAQMFRQLSRKRHLEFRFFDAQLEPGTHAEALSWNPT
jgi:hypothetical protein